MTITDSRTSQSGESRPIQPGGLGAWLNPRTLGGIAKWAVDCFLVLAIMLTAWRLISVRPVTQSDESRRQVRLRPLLDLGARLPTRVPSFESHGRTVVLLLDTRCPACQVSLPFYRALGRVTGETPGTEFVVLVEESVEEARSWLAVDGVVADRIMRIRSRARAGFLGTPTLLLVEQNGIITDIANQALSPADEQRFIERVRRPTVGPPFRVGYFMREFDVSAEPSISSNPTLQLVDTRDRAAFQREHSTGAINIPRDELLARSPAELLRALAIYVDCRHDDQELCRIAGATLQDAKFTDVRILLQ